MQELKDRVAWVTGGSRGIGHGIALRLARAGAHVAITARRESEAARKTVEALKDTGVRALAAYADLADSTQVESAYALVSGSLGAVDILVNNAGMFDYQYASAWELEPQVWRRMLDVNLTAVYATCAAAIPGMLAGNWGRIINISSTSGISGGTSGIHYAASKGGLNALTKALARELAPHSITVNAIAPSKIETDMFEASVPPEGYQQVIDKIPVGRLGQPEDVAEAVAFFASPEAGYTTGQVLVVSGGY